MAAVIKLCIGLAAVFVVLSCATESDNAGFIAQQPTDLIGEDTSPTSESEVPGAVATALASETPVPPIPEPPPTRSPSPTAQPSAAPVLTQLSISPDSITARAGEYVDVAVVALDQNGDELTDVDFKFSLTGEAGHIDESGRITVGEKSGEFQRALGVVASTGAESVSEQYDISITPGVLNQVTLSVDSTEVRVNEVVSLEVQGQDRFGNQIDGLPVSWETNPIAGSVRADGTFNAGTVTGYYSAAITAELADGVINMSSSVDITVVPGEIRFVSMIPDSVRLSLGETENFTFHATDRFGNRIQDLSTQWMAGSTGSIDADGNFFAEHIGVTNGWVEVQVTDGTTLASARAKAVVLPTVHHPPTYGSSSDVIALPRVGGNTFTFVNFGRVLEVTASTDSTPPQQVASLLLPADVRDIEITSDHLIASLEGGALAVVDVSSPSDPTLVQTFETDDLILNLAIVGNTLLASNETGMALFDISDLSAIERIGDFAIDQSRFKVLQVAATGNRAFLAGDLGFIIIDISDPSDPVDIGSVVDVAGFETTAIGVSGQFVVTGHGIQGVRVVDVSDPTNPLRVASTTFTSTPHHVSEILVKNDLAVVRYQPTGFNVFRLNVLGQPDDLGFSSMPSQLGRGYIQDGILYQPHDENGYHMMDLSSLSQPTFVGNYAPRRFPTSLVRAGELIYASEPRGIRIFEDSNRDMPDEIAFLDVTILDEPIVSLKKLDETRLVAKTQSSLGVYDINGTDLIEIAVISPIGGELVELSEGVAVIVDGTFVHRIDLSEPERPIRLSTVSVGDLVTDATLLGEILVVAQEETVSFQSPDSCPRACYEGAGLTVFDVSVTGAPSLIGRWNQASYISELEFADGLLYAIDRWHGLRIFDLSNPTNPEQLKNFEITANRSEQEGLVISKSIIFTTVSNSDGPDGLVILDVSDPRNPLLMDVIEDAAPDGLTRLENLGDSAWFVGLFPGAYTVDVSTTR